MSVRNGNIRQQLIEAGIHEISTYGLQGFSIRRIAAECGVSCAAPYKHFRDKAELIAEIKAYIDSIWTRRQQKMLENCPRDNRSRLVATSVEYVRFLVENPQFRSIIMIKYTDADQANEEMRAKMTDLSTEIVGAYCKEVHMPEDVHRRKLYVVRSLIYGAALMFDNGQMEYNEENMKFVEYNINREFSLP